MASCDVLSWGQRPARHNDIKPEAEMTSPKSKKDGHAIPAMDHQGSWAIQGQLVGNPIKPSTVTRPLFGHLRSTLHRKIHQNTVLGTHPDASRCKKSPGQILVWCVGLEIPVQRSEDGLKPLGHVGESLESSC